MKGIKKLVNNYQRAIVLTILFLSGILLYSSSLNGPFVFDDIHNLAALATNGGIVGFSSWIEFVFGGESSPLGRPLTLATFTINAQNWPADPFWFKLTNVLIHILNSIILFALIRKMLAFSKLTTNIRVANYIAFFAAFIWLVHPIHTTTILQVVQRMTLLSGTFTLLALYVYMRFINNQAIGFEKKSFKLLLSVGLITLLGILCKETSILVPLFIFVINLTILSGSFASSKRLKVALQIMLLFIPIATIAAIPLVFQDSYIEAWKHRDFELTERLLTESRILLVYLSKLFLPRAHSSGLFHDDIILSHNILNPISTLFSLLTIAALLSLGIILRRRFPYLSLAILFYFSGHLLESTILPLELYFEHRNYIPSLLLCFLFIEIIRQVEQHRLKLSYIVASFYCVLTASVTLINSYTWGNGTRLFTTWALENPKSIRAQHEAGYYWLYASGNISTARQFFTQAYQIDHTHIGTRLRLLETNCFFEQPIDDLQEIDRDLELSGSDSMYMLSLASIVSMKENGACNSININYLLNIIHKLKNNKNLTVDSGWYWLYYHESRLLYLTGKYEEAIKLSEYFYEKSKYAGAFVIAAKAAIANKNLSLARSLINQGLDATKNKLVFIDQHTLNELKRLKNHTVSKLNN